MWGKVIALEREIILFSVQPHACGEKWFGIGDLESPFGSTPRMWGKAENNFRAINSPRFNPTHVGKRKEEPQSGGLFSVQPHACGEKWGIGRRRIVSLGSTPRMWGKVC